MKMRLIWSVVIALGVMFLKAPCVAQAGFLDGFNKINQTIQQIDHTQRTVERAGSLIKPKKQPIQVSKPQKTSSLLSAKDRSAIEKAKRAWVAAFKSQDWDALVDQYAQSAVLMPPDEEMKVGHEAIRTNFETEETTSEEVFETIEINGTEMLAYVQGVFRFTIQSTSKESAPIQATGKYIEIWQKQSDGTWLITHDIWNADQI